jgi:RNA-directed DNA polymerase
MLGHVAKGLAFAFLAGPWTEAELIARARLALGVGGRARWLRGLVRRMLVAFPRAPIDRDDDLLALLRDDRALRPRVPRSGGRPRPTAHLPSRPRHWLFPDPAMVPVAGRPASFKVFPIPSEDVLARCLDVTADELDWFADLHHMNAKRAPSTALAHYHHRWVAKARGGWRLLEAPKPRMKHIQRWLLRNVLAPIPVSDVAHGAPSSLRTSAAPSSCAWICRTSSPR